MHKESFSVLEKRLYLEYLGGLYQSCVTKLPIKGYFFVIPSIHTVFNPDPVPQHNFFFFNTGLCCEPTTKTLFSQPRNLNVTTGVNRTGIVFSWLILSLLSINQRLLKYCEFKTMKSVAFFPQYIIFNFVKNCISEICFLENWQDLDHNKDNMANNAPYTLIIEDIFFLFISSKSKHSNISVQKSTQYMIKG